MLGRWLERQSKLLVLAEPPAVSMSAPEPRYITCCAAAPTRDRSPDRHLGHRGGDPDLRHDRGDVAGTGSGRHRADEVDRAQLIRQAAADTTEVAAAS